MICDYSPILKRMKDLGSSVQARLPAYQAWIGVGKTYASPPSEPCVRFSRTRLSSWSSPHRDWLSVITIIDVLISKLFDGLEGDEGVMA